MKKICFIIPTLDAGGVENYLLRFLQYYDRPNHQITVLVRNNSPGDLGELYRKLNVSVIRQEVGYLNPIKWYALYKHFKKASYDTVCDFNGNFAGIPMLMAKLSGTKKRLTFYRRSSRGYKETQLRLTYDNLMNYLVSRYATKILSNSNYALEFFFDKDSTQHSSMSVIPNGIDMKVYNNRIPKERARKQLGIKDDVFLVGHVGRFDPAKNHKFFFKVAKILVQKWDNTQLLFCGKGTDSSEFKQLADKYDIGSKCIFLGLQNDIPLILSALDLFFFLSQTEGQPNALLEAMAIGTPIIASDIKPIKEIIPSRYYDEVLVKIDNAGTAAEKILELRKKGNTQSKLQTFIREHYKSGKNYKKFENEL